MAQNDKLDKLEQAAKEYIDKQRKRLNAEYDFFDSVLKARGASKISDHNNDKAAELLIKSINDFLS